MEAYYQLRQNIEKEMRERSTPNIAANRLASSIHLIKNEFQSIFTQEEFPLDLYGPFVLWYDNVVMFYLALITENFCANYRGRFNRLINSDGKFSVVLPDNSSGVLSYEEFFVWHQNKYIVQLTCKLTDAADVTRMAIIEAGDVNGHAAFQHYARRVSTAIMEIFMDDNRTRKAKLWDVKYAKKFGQQS